LFSGFDDAGGTLDQESMEKLFGCSGRVSTAAVTPLQLEQRLNAEAARHARATVSMSLEQNSAHFNQAREKLERWADDVVVSAEEALGDTKEQIKALRREARHVATLEQQRVIQEKLQKLERQQRRQRQEIFTVEDEIMEKRDSLIDQLEKRLVQRTEAETLFTIRWRVV
jgi:Fe2+ transport system protein B